MTLLSNMESRLICSNRDMAKMSKVIGPNALDRICDKTLSYMEGLIRDEYYRKLQRKGG